MNLYHFEYEPGDDDSWPITIAKDILHLLGIAVAGGASGFFIAFGFAAWWWLFGDMIQ